MFAIDEPALERAIAELNLQFRVHIQLQVAKHYIGKYKGLRDMPHKGRRTFPGGESRHIIVLAAGLYPSTASGALWHELRHAWQCETWHDSDSDAFMREYVAARKATNSMGAGTSARSASVTARYRAIKWEADAFDFQDRMFDRRLCRWAADDERPIPDTPLLRSMLRTAEREQEPVAYLGYSYTPADLRSLYDAHR